MKLFFGFTLFISVFGQQPSYFNHVVLDVVQHGKVGTLKDFRNLGYSLESQDVTGQTPLHYACQQGDLEMVRYLLSQKVNIKIKDKLGRTSCMVAAQNGKGQIVKLLLEKGANANTKDKFGTPCLVWACVAQDLVCLKTLVHHGAKVNATDAKGRTALDVVRFDLKQMNLTKFLAEMGGKKGSLTRADADFAMSLKTQMKKSLKQYGGPVKTFTVLSQAQHDSLHRSVVWFLNDQVDQAMSIIDTMPRSCSWCLLFKTLMLSKQRLYEEANFMMQTWPQGVPNQWKADVLFLMGKWAFQAGDYSFATQFLTNSNLEKASSPAEKEYFLGYLADERDDISRAKFYLSEYLKTGKNEDFRRDAQMRMSQLGEGVIPLRSLEEGIRLNLNDYKGQWVLLDFWAADGRYERYTFKSLAKIYDSLSQTSFAIISVNVDEKDGHAKDLVMSLNPSWGQYTDPRLAFSKNYWNVMEIPTFVLLDPNGKESARFVDDETEEAKKIAKFIKKQMKGD